MSEVFDPYHKWLGVPQVEQPPNHYRLLAIALFEDDPDVIEVAADQRMAHLRTFQAGPRSALSQKLLNEMAAAKLCLLNSEKKTAYDAELRRQFVSARPQQPDVLPSEPVTVPQAPLNSPQVPQAPIQPTALGPLPSVLNPVAINPIPLNSVRSQTTLCHASAPTTDRRHLHLMAVLSGVAGLLVVIVGTMAIALRETPETAGGGDQAHDAAAEERLISVTEGDSQSAPTSIEDPILPDLPVSETRSSNTLAKEDDGGLAPKQVAPKESATIPLSVEVTATAASQKPRQPTRDIIVEAKSREATNKDADPAKMPLRVEAPSPVASSANPGDTITPSGKPIPGLDDPAFQQWLKEVGMLPAEKQADAVGKKLQEFNPSFNGRVIYKSDAGAVTELAFFTTVTKNILPVRALGQLKTLRFETSRSSNWRTALSDLTPLAGMQLTTLECSGTKVSDLSPLEGMPLTTLNCAGLQVSDLSPLRGMPLTNLDISRTKVSDLSPLKGMRLTRLNCSYTQVSDLSPLEGMPLTNLGIAHTPVSDVSPLNGAPLEAIDRSGTKVSDLSPLKGSPLLPIVDDPKNESALVGRETGMKALLLGKYGGNGMTEDAVGRALAWLAKQQRKDGSWSLNGPYKSGAIGNDVPEAATALAMLAFQGNGHSHRRGEFQQQVAKGVNALLRMQQGNGSFFQPGGETNNCFYAHAQATMAVCELYGMTKDPNLREPAVKAIKFLIESQDPKLGGWRYMPRSDSDTSVTGWVVMAFQTARMAGLEVPSLVLSKIGEYLDQVTRDGSMYGYQVGTEPSLATTAEALLCRQYLGWRRDDPRLVAGAEQVLKYLPRYEDRDVYYWYYGTQMMHHMDGKYWAAWNGALRDQLIKHQEMTGPEKGSWGPFGEHPDKWPSRGKGGRLYTTCLSVYMLEVYYRYLPIYGFGR